MEPIKDVGVETKIDMETSVMYSHVYKDGNNNQLYVCITIKKSGRRIIISRAV
jgi:hypothetical protein